MLLHHVLWFKDLREAILFAPCVAFAYYLVAAACARRFFNRARTSPPAHTPPVSILKPVRGLDRMAYENFASFCRLDYPVYEILFGVADPMDPAVPVIRRLIADFPSCSIRIFTGMGQPGPNEKASILAHLVRQARHDLLVVSDSDTRVTADCLRVLAAPFADPQTGAVSCLYRGEQAVTLADRLEATGVSSEFFAGVFVADQFDGGGFALGATMAMTRAHLEEIGGFEALADYLLDDYELGRRIAKLGYRVELLPFIVSMVLPAQTFRGYWQRQLRWAIGVRHARPWGHLGLAVTQGLPLTLAAMLVSRSIREAGFYLAAYLVARNAMAWTVGVSGLKDKILRGGLWLVPLRDALAFGAWCASLRYRRVNWRGAVFTVRKGRLTPTLP
ncbi:MAG: bacteriohopanetetrol glucosamine biosynthesis glycosyltransferase HpnI [Terriglobia bacterium]